MKSKLKLYRVEWDDSASSGGWRKGDEIRKESRSTVSIVSAGYLVKRRKKEIVLCQSYDEQGKINDTIAIPIGCVRKIRKVREP